MKKAVKKISLLLALLITVTAFSSCGKKRAPNIAESIKKVYINGKEVNTVESFAGAFSGVQGDMIEFRFDKPQTLNTLYIMEKTASVKQFNIYAEIDGEFALVYTGKEILAQFCTFETVEASAVRVKIVNTDIGKNEFVIQGIDFYNIALESEVQK